MEGNYITLDQISDITGLQTGTIRTYLGRAEFTKYVTRFKISKIYKIFCLFNEEFMTDLYKFLILKKQKKSAEAIQKYWNIYKKMNKKPETVNMELEKKYEIASKQYQSLLKRYNEVLIINKKLEIIDKICQEPADNIAVLDLQNRIKEVLNE